MLRVLVLVLVVAFAAAQLDDIWSAYKLKYEKGYGRIEETFRRNVFERTVASIQSHNLAADLGFSTYRQGINQFSDMTNAEFRAIVNGFRGNSSAPRTAPLHVVESDDRPKTVDWRKKGYVTPIKDQGQCGSCWAFSAVASLEGQHFAKKGKLVSLSEQNFVDCSDSEGNMGCNGGLMDQAFQYVIDNKGLDTEKCYPYTAEDDSCTFKKSCIGTLEVGYKDVEKGSEDALQDAIAKIGPISVAIDAGHESFQSYSSGVYDEPDCSSTELDHGVTAVGYDSDSGDDYYIVKNSWGKSWGMKGYIWMSRNKDNQCGIATMSSYPTM